MNATLVLSVLPVLLGQLDPLVHTGSWTQHLRAPARVAVRPDGGVYVTVPFYNHIARYNAAP